MKLRNKIISIVLVVVLLTGGIIVASILNKKNETPASTVVLSLNPEIQLVLNGSDKVVSVNYLNDDGEILMYNQKLEGKSIEQVAKLFTELSIKAGYVNCNSTADDNGTNVVEYEVTSENDGATARIEQKLKIQINKVFKEQLIYGKARSLANQSYDSLLEKYTDIANNLNLDLVELDNMTEQEILDAIKQRSKQLKGIKSSFLGLLSNENLNSAIKALINQVGDLKELITEIKFELESDSSNEALLNQLNNLELQLKNVKEQLNQKYQEYIEELKTQSEEYLKTVTNQLQEKIDAYSQTLTDHNDTVTPNKDVVESDIESWQDQ